MVPSRLGRAPKTIILLVLMLQPLALAAAPRSFEEGSLIIPMDIDFQDEGMLQAFGLVYQLLLNDIQVYWVINPDKEFGGVDFTATAVDVTDVAEEPAPITHGYRGGPFVVAAGEAELALSVVAAWQVEHVTVVHRAVEAFEGEVSKTMTVAPTIGVFADGNEDIAFGYLNAAAIPDSLGRSWPSRRDASAAYPGYPDVLNVGEIRGPTVDNPSDGALFDEHGLPVFCQLMTMHWGENERDDAAIAEIRAFLNYPTHFFAECQAVNAVENSVNGHFLTPNGYIREDRPRDVEFRNVHLPFVQLDGPFQTVGGSEASYDLPAGDEYYDLGVVMITQSGTPIGTHDVWMTGYLDGLCHIDPKEDEMYCDSTVGKISYLGGHRYNIETPISEHPDTQGTRLFLNSLFEADCVTDIGQARLSVELAAPDWTDQATFDYQIRIENSGIGVGLDLVLSDTLPDGMSLVEAVPAPTYFEGAEVTWNLGNMAPQSSIGVQVQVELDAEGLYENQCQLDFRQGQNARRVMSNVAATLFSTEPPESDERPETDGDLAPVDDGGTADDDTGGLDALDGDASPDAGTDAGPVDAGQPDGLGDAGDLGGDGSAITDSTDPPGAGGVRTAEEGCGCYQTPLPVPHLLSLLGYLVLCCRNRRGSPR